MKNKKIKTIVTLDVINRITVLLHIATVWISLNYKYSPPKEILQEIMSVSSENIIGLYGITLTGYVFFLSRIDNLLVNNPELGNIIFSIKKNFGKMIWGITLNVVIALLGMGISTYFWTNHIILPEWCYYLIANETLLFIGMAILLILYFVIRVIDAEIIEKEALKIKNEISAEKGDMDSFNEYITLYNELKQLCMKNVPSDLQNFFEDTQHLEFSVVLQYLKNASSANKCIYENVEKIHMYYYCILYSKNFEISNEMCELAKNTKKELIESKGKKICKQSI